MKRTILAALAAASMMLFSCTANTEQEITYPVTTNGYIVAAYIWPSCHDDALAHKYLWEDGEGEWQVIKKGDKRIPEQYQPRQPLWGYEMDDDPKVVEKWIDAATAHGVNTFVYDWYWFMEQDYLESAINQGFLGASNNRKMNFYIMWANHWVKHNYWNYHKWGDDTSILFAPTVDWENYKKIVDRVINQYFKQPNYLKIDGCPIMAIFSMKELVSSFGSYEETEKALQYFRDEAVKAGFKGVHFQVNYGGGFHLDATKGKAAVEEISKLSINSVAFYNMGGFNPDYLLHGQNAESIREEWAEAYKGTGVSIFPTVSIGWDDTPRFPAKKEGDFTQFHNTPTSFATFLSHARHFADKHADTQPKFVYINAWNEWVEGSYLLPDMLNGFGYLEAVQDVFVNEKYERFLQK